MLSRSQTDLLYAKIDHVHKHWQNQELLSDDHTQYIKHSLATVVSDFLVASGVGVFVKKTLAEVKTILGLGTAAYTAATDYVTHALATAANDFLVASGAGAFVKKTPAEVRTILFQKARAYRANAQAIPATTATKIEIDTDSFDPANITDLTNHRIIPTLAGYYQVSGQCQIVASPDTVEIIAFVTKNGSSIIAGGRVSSGAYAIGFPVSGLVYCNGSTDYLELSIYITLAKNLELADDRNFLSVVGPF
jgi:hypothetical protein